MPLSVLPQTCKVGGGGAPRFLYKAILLGSWSREQRGQSPDAPEASTTLGLTRKEILPSAFECTSAYLHSRRGVIIAFPMKKTKC